MSHGSDYDGEVAIQTPCRSFQSIRTASTPSLIPIQPCNSNRQRIACELALLSMTARAESLSSVKLLTWNQAITYITSGTASGTAPGTAPGNRQQASLMYLSCLAKYRDLLAFSHYLPNSLVPVHTSTIIYSKPTRACPVRHRQRSCS